MVVKKFFTILTVVSAAFLAGCSESYVGVPGSQIDTVMVREVPLTMDYLLYLPEDYGSDAAKQWPLVVFLHGAGERGTDVNMVKAHGPAMLVEQGKDFDFILVSPQCPPDKWWANRVEYIMALIDDMTEKYNVDESRVYLTGLSMGGYGTWATATLHPERFAAIAPICGGGQPYLAHNLKDMPIWAFHGTADNVVPVQLSRDMVEAVNSAGGNAKLTEYPGVGHNSWTETYNNEELYKWLLSQKKD